MSNTFNFEPSFVQTPAFRVDRIPLPTKYDMDNVVLSEISIQPMPVINSMRLKAIQDIQSEEDRNIFQAINNCVDEKIKIEIEIKELKTKRINKIKNCISELEL